VTVGQPTSGESLDRAVDAYRAATPGSAALHSRAAVRLPAGVTSNVKFFPPYPVYLSRAEGAHVFDVDGREYIDYCLAFGPLITGHGHPRVMAAIKAELARAGTTILGAPGDLELRLAERLARLVPSAEMVRFTNSGTEATMHALRIARAATGRSRVIKFEGHYHGVHDHVLWNLDQALPPKPASDGIPRATAEQTIVVPFGDLDAVREAFEHDSEIAAVIVEPVSRGVIHPDRSFLQGLRDETTRHGAVLVFDEVVAWPRVGLRGAQALYGVTPDLTTLGKAIGGGLPLGALVGRRDLMALTAPRAVRLDADAARPYVFHSGTYNGTPIALAAGLATLNLLEEPGVLEKLDALAGSLREGLREIGRRRAIPLSVAGTGSVADFYFTPSPVRSSRDVWASDLLRRRAVDYRLLAAGVYNVPVHRYHLSLAHTTGDIATTLDLIDRALDA
jgi:glutamate-1-semialdehyde 2,1-aminomutase